MSEKSLEPTARSRIKETCVSLGLDDEGPENVVSIGCLTGASSASATPAHSRKGSGCRSR